MMFTLVWAGIAAALANKAEAITLNRMVGVDMMVTGFVVLSVKYLLKK